MSILYHAGAGRWAECSARRSGVPLRPTEVVGAGRKSMAQYISNR